VGPPRFEIPNRTEAGFFVNVFARLLVQKGFSGRQHFVQRPQAAMLDHCRAFRKEGLATPRAHEYLYYKNYIDKNFLFYFKKPFLKAENFLNRVYKF